MGETIEKRGGQLLVGEHVEPLAEGKVGGDHRGATLVAVADEIEQLAQEVSRLDN